MAASKPVLHSYFRSSCSWRVRTALALKGIDYEYKAVNLLKGEQLSDAYRSVNPLGQVPAIEIDGVLMTQSLPIIEYLEETRPNCSLLPKDPIKRCMARQVAEIINAGIQPLQESTLHPSVQRAAPEILSASRAADMISKKFVGMDLPDFRGKTCLIGRPLYKHMHGIGMDVPPTLDGKRGAIYNLSMIKFVGGDRKLELGNTFITKGFQALEKTLETTSGKYCVGDEVTVADVFLVPQVYNALRFEVNMTAFPIISRINNALDDIDAFKISHPSRQPDCPEDLRPQDSSRL